MSVAIRTAGPSSADRDRKYRAALRWLEKEACYIAADVMKLGRPRFVPGAGTAYVALLDSALLFGFDPDWFDALSERRVAAVLVHESLHVVLGHLFVSYPGRRGVWQLACDAVVNDLIAHYYPKLPLPEPHVTGRRLIGRDTVGMTAEEVLALLPPDAEALAACCVPLDDHRYWGREASSGGAGPARLHEARLLDALAEIAARNRDVDRWGGEALGALRRVRERGSRFDLEQLLLGRIGRRLRLGVRGRRRPRRLAAFRGEVILPTYPEIHRLEVLLAIDASGSVGDDWLGVFVRLARRPLKECRVEAVSFDTRTYDFDPIRAAAPLGGGGTDFQAVEALAASRRRYPDLVIALTDGWAPRPRLRHPDRWLWCLSDARRVPELLGLGEILLLPDRL